jgi:hypothetical protein
MSHRRPLQWCQFLTKFHQNLSTGSKVIRGYTHRHTHIQTDWWFHKATFIFWTVGWNGSLQFMNIKTHGETSNFGTFHCCSVRLTCRCTVWSAVLCQLQEPLTVPRLKTPHTLSIELTLASLKSPDKRSPYPLNSPNRRILITRFACSYHTSPSITLVRGGLILTPASWIYPHKYHGRSSKKTGPVGRVTLVLTATISNLSAPTIQENLTFKAER